MDSAVNRPGSWRRTVGLSLDAFASELAPTIVPTRSPLTLFLSLAMRGEEMHTHCCVCGHDLRMGGHAIEPQGKECPPHPEFLAWHRTEVFKEPARD